MALRSRVFFVALLALVVSALPAVQGAKGPGKGPGAKPGAVGSKTVNPAAAALGKLRADMLKYYCANGQHSDVPPCQTHSFMQKLRAATAPEDKKKMLAARQEEMKKLSPEERKKMQTGAKEAYATMYKEYCGTTSIPDKNPDVCSNSLLKNLYGKK